MFSRHPKLWLFGLFVVFLVAVILYGTGARGANAATPNSVDVFVKARMLYARYPTAFVRLTVRNSSSYSFNTVGHLLTTEDGAPIAPIVLTFPFSFDGAKPDLHWSMSLKPLQTRVLTFKVRVTAKRLYCLKVVTDNMIVGKQKGGTAYGRGCVSIR